MLDLPGAGASCCATCTRASSAWSRSRRRRASPFASSLLFDYVATYMYEGDTPNAERRAAALALDRDLLRELLGQEELRELIDPEALDEVEAQLQHRTEAGRAEDRDALQQVLRRLGDLTAEECEERVAEGYSAASMLEKLGRERRAALVRIAGEERYIAAEDAGLYRDALGVPPPPGLPETFLERRARRAARPGAPLRPHPRPVPDRAARPPATGSTRRPALRELERAGDAGPRRAPARRAPSASGATPTCCAGCAAPASPTCAARSRPPTPRARPLPAELAERRRPPARRRRPRPPARGAGPAAGRRADARRSGSGTSCRGASAPTARPGSTSSAPAASWSGSAPARSAAATAGSPSTSARTCASPARRRRTPSSSAPEGEVHDAIRERLAGRPCFWLDLLADLDHPREELHAALWDLAWAGEVTNDAFAPLRAPRLRARAARPSGAGRRFARRRAAAGRRRARAAGR